MSLVLGVRASVQRETHWVRMVQKAELDMLKV